MITKKFIKVKCAMMKQVSCLDSNLLVPHSHLIKRYDNSNTTTADINHSLPQKLLSILVFPNNIGSCQELLNRSNNINVLQFFQGFNEGSPCEVRALRLLPFHYYTLKFVSSI